MSTATVLKWDNWKQVKENIQHYQKEFNIPNTIKYSRENDASDYQEVLMNAKLLKNYIFTYRKPLDMEPCYIPYRMEPIKWTESPNGDPEWLFMLHRQEYLLDLIIAYFETEDLVYLERWKEIVFDWIKGNPLNEDTKSIAWRTIDTGIRCFNWCRSLLLLLPLNFLTEEEEKHIMLSIREQLIYINKSYIDKYDLSNWGILQVAGLFICESWFEDVLQLNLQSWAVKKLEDQLFIQVNEKGVHWEQSPLYQYETLFYLLSVLNHAQLNEYDVDKEFVLRVKKLAYNSVHWMQPNGKILPQSDTDQVDPSYILTYAEIVLNERFIPFQVTSKSYSTVSWIVGWETFEAYCKGGKLTQRKFDTDDFDVKTGNSWSRTNWSDTADLLSVHSGPIGSGHGHLDLGHFNYSYQGMPVFIDSGRYSYVDSPLRTYLKSARAHNTVIVDNQDFSEAVGSWKYGETAIPQSFNFIKKGNISISECIYAAILNDGSNYTVRRRYIYIKELSTVLISDFIMATGDHKARRLFHIDPNVLPRKLSSKKWELQTKNGVLHQHFFDDTKTTAKSTLISPLYNSLTNTNAIEASNYFKNYGSFLTVIAPEDVSVYKGKVYQSGTEADVDPLYMEALVLEGEKKISILHGQLDTVHGHKIYRYNNSSFYGRLNVLQHGNGVERYL